MTKLLISADIELDETHPEEEDDDDDEEAQFIRKDKPSSFYTSSERTWSIINSPINM